MSTHNSRSRRLQPGGLEEEVLAFYRALGEPANSGDIYARLNAGYPEWRHVPRDDFTGIMARLIRAGKLVVYRRALDRERPWLVWSGWGVPGLVGQGETDLSKPPPLVVQG